MKLSAASRPKGPLYPPVGGLTYIQGPHATYEKISSF